MNITKLNVLILICDRSGYSNKLLSQFGLSMLVTVQWDDNTEKRIMFDTGWDSPALLSNLRSLGLSVAQVDALVLSHCHYDHTGGLDGLLKAGKPVLLDIFAQKEIFRSTYTDSPDIHFIGLDRKVVKQYDPSKIHLIDMAAEIYPGVYLTGEIPRVTPFEKAEDHVFVMEGGVMTPDPEKDDMAIIFDLKENGLVIITGCCHAGIINTICHARSITGNNGELLLAGGFHLIDSSDTVRKKTIEALRYEPIKVIYTGHCTGFAAEKMLSDCFGEKLHQFYTGDSITLHNSVNRE